VSKPKKYGLQMTKGLQHSSPHKNRTANNALDQKFKYNSNASQGGAKVLNVHLDQCLHLTATNCAFTPQLNADVPATLCPPLMAREVMSSLYSIKAGMLLRAQRRVNGCFMGHMACKILGPPPYSYDNELPQTPETISKG
jgi:hypothetical protein